MKTGSVVLTFLAFACIISKQDVFWHNFYAPCIILPSFLRGNRLIG